MISFHFGSILNEKKRKDKRKDKRDYQPALYLVAKYLTKYFGSTHQWFRFCFPLNCVAVWLCTIENQSLKQRKKAFEARKKLYHNVYLRPLYRNLKAVIIVYNQLLFFFLCEDDEIISWLPSVKRSTLKRMKRNNLGILSSLTFK